jgi:N-glycosylase/DNA lyase
LRNPAHPAFGATPDEIDAKATYRGAHDALVQLTGVGAKVADCVCLMGLGWGGAIPVDTHVWQIAQRDYKYGARGKTLNKAMYDGIGDLFRGLWGEYAGWAHSVLFTADLKSFSGQGKVAIKQEGEGVKVELKEEEGLAQAATSAKKKRRGATLEVTQIKQEVEEADLVQLKVDADLERPAQAARTTRKRTRTDITAEVVDAKREGAEPASVGGEDGEFHRSISETVGKRRRTRVNYKE